MDGMQEFDALMAKLGASEGVPVAKVKSLKGVVGTLMWLAYLPEDEQRQFWWELFSALDDVVCDQASPSAAAYAKAAGQLMHEWKATAQAHADGLPEIFAAAEAEEGDFGEVPPPKPASWTTPRYMRGSVITQGTGFGSRRWEVMAVLNAHYRVRALFSALGEPDLSTWEFGLCEAATVLEWQKDFREGVIGSDGISRIPQEAQTDDD